MKFHHLRHATSILTYGGKQFLIDPMLGPAGIRPAVANTPNQQPNPIGELPAGALEAISQVDAVLITHLHGDHLDDHGREQSPAGVPWICQPEDAEKLEAADLHPIDSAITWEGITISRVAAQHGPADFAPKLGPVSGFVLQADAEPTLYLASDTIWYPGVAETIRSFQPDVIVINGGGAYMFPAGALVMTAADIAAVRGAVSNAELVIVHLDTINHCTESRAYLRKVLPQLGVVDGLQIPDDGEELTIQT